MSSYDTPWRRNMYNDLKRMIESHARTEGCTEQAALRDLGGELQALATDMGLDLKAALERPNTDTGDLGERVEELQNQMEWDDEIIVSLALRFLTAIGQCDQFMAFLQSEADAERQELGSDDDNDPDPGDMDGDHETGLSTVYGETDPGDYDQFEGNEDW
jgi:hypothetical protein